MNTIYKSILFLLFIPVAIFSYSQSSLKIVYNYDAAGNCISRVEENRLLSPSVSPNSIDLSDFMFSKSLKKESFNIYPNPTKDVLFVELANYLPETDGRIDFKVLDLKGSVVLDGKISTSHTPINFHKFPTGVYMLHIETEGGTFTWKIIKEN